MANGTVLRRSVGTTACLLLTLGLAACDDDGTTPEGEVTLQVLLTDAAAEYIAAAEVDIGAIELIGGPGGPVPLTLDGTDGMVNLLELQNEVTMVLADIEIEAGTYSQLRLIVENASVTLEDGLEFNGGGTSQVLIVPSGAQTGIKLNLSAVDGEGGGLAITEDMVLVVDFDVNQSFVLLGNPLTPAGVEGVLFTPTLRVTVDDVSASIAGTVTTAVPDLDVSGMVVEAVPTEGTTLEPFQSETATALVEDDGTYAIYFLVPGEYTVSVDAGEGFTSEIVVVTVGAGEALADIDLEVVEQGP